MNGKEMVDMLGVFVDDIDDAAYTRKIKLSALNTAAISMFGMLPEQYTTIFEETIDDIASGYDIMELKNTEEKNIRGGINCLRRVFVNTIEKYADKSSMLQQQKNVNAGLKDYYISPRYYVVNTTLTLVPSDYTATLTYIVNPSAIIDTEAAFTLMYDEMFHNSLVKLASGILTNNPDVSIIVGAEIKKIAAEFMGVGKLNKNEPYKDGVIADPQWDEI